VDTTLLKPSTVLRTPAEISVVHPAAASLVGHVHLTVVGRSRPCARKTVNETISSSILERMRGFVTSGPGYVGQIDLPFQCLVVILDSLMRYGLFFISFRKFKVLGFERAPCSACIAAQL
jgi:hypothetical protein